ncbi:unnamed protein product [Toxocara canis]|uniref:Pre-mRNA-splicing factor SYF2 n=1 Tax=Toxocara canis TaxID=6265 RepID=A0A183U2Y8_TOXCA|nr:unnamed protein product [Toxocara canis]
MVGDVVAEAQRVNTMRELVSPTTDESTEKKKNSITDRLEIVEKEKKHLDAQLTIIQRKKEHHDCELAKLAKLGEDKSSEKESEECADESSMSLVERIYAENRRKAAEAHAATKNAPALPPLFADTVPLYQNPADCPLVQETIERYQIVKPLLVKMLIDKKQKESLAQKYQTEKYNVMYAEWLAKDERYCKSQKKMARDEKHREIFERTFPELKKAREERERNGRSNGGNGGTSKKSDAEQVLSFDYSADASPYLFGIVILPIFSVHSVPMLYIIWPLLSVLCCHPFPSPISALAFCQVEVIQSMIGILGGKIYNEQI